MKPAGIATRPSGQGKHLCWTYGSDDEMRAGLAQYVGDGLLAGDLVLCELSASRLEAARSDLFAGIPEAREAERTGSLIFRSTIEAYLPGGVFEPDVRLVSVSEMVRRALAQGYRSLRVLSETADLKQNRSAIEHWPAYELRSDFLAARTGIATVCAYDMRVCKGDAMTLLRSLHTQWYGSSEERPHFGLCASRDGGLAVWGEIDMSNAATVASLARRAAGDATEAVLDLGGVRFADVSGVRAVRNALEALGAARGPVRIRGASPAFRRLWSLMFPAHERDEPVFELASVSGDAAAPR